MTLETLGWNKTFRTLFAPHAESGLVPARISSVAPGIFTVYAELGVLEARLSGRAMHELDEAGMAPVTGDWVALAPRPEEGAGTIRALLSRRNLFSRKVPGKITKEQGLAANVDVVLVMTALDGDFSPRRVERYLTLAWEHRCEPIVVLTKADLVDEGRLERSIAEMRVAAPTVPIVAISTVSGAGVPVLAGLIEPGKTHVLIGSSGVGKTTLLNALCGGGTRKVNEVRASDGRGRHTTTHREITILPSGGIVIDNPGLREVQLWATDEGLSRSFEEIADLASRCRFRDCSHREEPGCAVLEALESGELDRGRYESWLKQEREIRFLELRSDENAARAEKEKWKKISKHIRRYERERS